MASRPLSFSAASLLLLASFLALLLAPAHGQAITIWTGQSVKEYDYHTPCCYFLQNSTDKSDWGLTCLPYHNRMFPVYWPTALIGEVTNASKPNNASMWCTMQLRLSTKFNPIAQGYTWPPLGVWQQLNEPPLLVNSRMRFACPEPFTNFTQYVTGDGYVFSKCSRY